MKKQAAADVTPVRQRTQYSCMSTSMMMCLRANGVDTNEDEVNRVMGARPMRGAAWEDAIACAQHYGMRVRLICPATVRQLKDFTDRGIPVMIAWNPEGRDWSHASVVFDVDADLNVHVADPNIPDPDETVRVVPKGEFYKKWFEKWPDYLVRRPAMAVEREISEDGRQMVASTRKQAGVPSDVAKFFGLPPYDEASNIDYNDSYSFLELKRKYGVRNEQELARKFGISSRDLGRADREMQQKYRRATQCSGNNEPIPESEQEIARWYVRATEELHQSMLNVLGASAAALAARRLPTGRPFDMFVDGVGEEYPFDGSIEEMVKRTGSWRDDVRSRFDSLWSGCYQQPSTVEMSSRVAARFVGRKSRKS